ncbi:MAG: hypothetical protein MUF71_09395 [Candidatus Kapabacteria bacterium]|jgi:hypothetical protein|nr:hypothetical protein [Candidatus Kapabacteria bacterium]
MAITLGVYFVSVAFLLLSGVGIASLLRWILPQLDYSISILLGVIASFIGIRAVMAVAPKPRQIFDQYYEEEVMPVNETMMWIPDSALEEEPIRRKQRSRTKRKS